MRVLLTTDTVGGVFTYAVELAGALAARGVEVTLAALGDRPSPAQRAEVARLPGVGLHALPGRLEWMEAPWDDVERTGRRLLALAHGLRPDVVHLDEYAHAALPYGAPTVVVGHSCVSSWFEAVRGEAPPPSFDRYRRVVARGLAAAAAVVAPSRAMLAALERHHGPLRRALVIPNGRDPRRFLPGPKQPFVLTAGRLWDPAKNVAALEAVAGELPWPVIVAGDAREPGRPGATAALRRSRPLGPLDARALAGWYARAAIYAAPALYEPFGLAILEAALAGCALVLSDLPSLRERWAGAARFVAPRDERALAGALRALIADEAARADLAARARAVALDHGPGRMADAYLALYRDLAARRGPRASAASPPATGPEEESPCAS